MDSERWREVKNLLDAALERAPAERAAFLDNACEGDEGLRSELATLLRAADEAGGFLEESVSFTDLLPADADSPMPSWIGPYRLLRRLGSGGMGEVFEAEQEEPIRRRVALKIVRPGLETRDILRRFKAERQALARMEHAHIARVFDAGMTTEGRPYVAMEYVDGEPITTYCDGKRLNMRDRLELFLKVCAAVQHAHQKAILHRDLKPSNVLVAEVDGEAVPKIIDFGIAKVVDEAQTGQSPATEHGLIVGTPEYMSPEQASRGALDVDTRADVYALGVLLYELLCGTLPLDRRLLKEGALDEVWRCIRELEPPRPSVRATQSAAAEEAAHRRRTTRPGLAGQIRGDLDWITMRALEKERERRYGSPAALAADIVRYLSDQPVVAGPPSVRYRARKFVRRHRVAVSVVAIVGLIAIGSGVALTLQASRIVRERDRAEREAVTATEVEAFMIELFDSSDPAYGGVKDLTARQILENAARKIAMGLETEPDVRARLLVAMARAHLALSELETAEEMIREALAIQEGVPRRNEVDAATTLMVLGRVLNRRADYGKALPSITEAIRIREEAYGADSLPVAEVLRDLAGNRRETGDFKEAQRALDRIHGILTAHPDTTAVDLAVSLEDLSTFYMESDDLALAEDFARQALETLESELGPDHPRIVRKARTLANALAAQAKHEEAWPLFERSLRIAERYYGGSHNEVAYSAYNLGVYYTDLEQYDRALELIHQSREAWEELSGPAHPDVAYAYRMLGRIHLARGELDEAKTAAEHAVEIDRGHRDTKEESLVDSLSRLAQVQLARAEFEGARLLLAEAYAIRRRAAESEGAGARDKIVWAKCLLRSEMEDLRDPEAALPFAREANELTGYSRPLYLRELALALHLTGSSSEAIQMQRKAIALAPESPVELRATLDQGLAKYEAAALADRPNGP